MSTSASMSTANITRIMGHPPFLKAFCRLLTRVVLLAFAEKTKNAQFLPAWTLVPPVWIEQTTCRLQGGCSATELRRRRSGLYATSPSFRAPRARVNDRAPVRYLRPCLLKHRERGPRAV